MVSFLLPFRFSSGLSIDSDDVFRALVNNWKDAMQYTEKADRNRKDGAAPSDKPMNSPMPSGEAALSATPDAEALLVQRAKERSPSAWTEIYDAYYPRLFRYCYARTSDQATAAELTSQVYLEALQSIDRYVYRGRPLLAWLYRIAHNVVVDQFRRRQRESKALQEAGVLSDAHDAGPALMVAQRHDLEIAMRQLTGDQQHVIALRYFAGLTTAEIAQTLERSERAVYSLEVRALAAMRHLLEGQ
jgi:RNA polymerase sigma-70 factor (ECF subfamily)